MKTREVDKDHFAKSGNRKFHVQRIVNMYYELQPLNFASNPFQSLRFKGFQRLQKSFRKVRNSVGYVRGL